MVDSNRSRARARQRRLAEQAKALRDLSTALNRLATAQERLDAAKKDVDAALLRVMDLRAPAREAMALLGVSHATYWRRVRAVRESTSATAPTRRTTEGE